MFLIDMFNKKTILPDAATALAGREGEISTAADHFVSGRPLKGPYPDGMSSVKEVRRESDCSTRETGRTTKVPEPWRRTRSPSRTRSSTALRTVTRLTLA